MQMITKHKDKYCHDMKYRNIYIYRNIDMISSGTQYKNCMFLFN